MIRLYYKNAAKSRKTVVGTDLKVFVYPLLDGLDLTWRMEMMNAILVDRQSGVVAGDEIEDGILIHHFVLLAIEDMRLDVPFVFFI